jgi:LCP family protein required for cell wall assembly
LDQTDNILVLGVDHRSGDPEPSWRTDTIMVVAVDRAASRVGVIGIPRDLYVEIPGLGEARINQADFFGEATDYPGGGPALLRQVLTETLEIPTQHYVRVQMDGLVRLVDALGGVTVTLGCPLYERTPDESSPNGMADWSLPAGQVHLDGQTARKFVTYRYVTNDFGRAQRQQQLLWALRDRALQLDVIPKIPELWQVLADTFTTDLGLLDVVRLAQLGAALRPEQVHGLVFGPKVLESFITDEGAWVLTIRDYDRLEQEKAQLFSAQPLAQLGHSVAGECPPAPTAIPTFTPTPAVSPTPTAVSAVHPDRRRANGSSLLHHPSYFLTGEVAGFGVGSGDLPVFVAGSNCLVGAFCCTADGVGVGVLSC